ncbi:MAG TPA: hypothetical protein VF178_06850 [Gemmatimonadaceae bacterium]
MFVRTAERAVEVWDRFQLPSEGFESAMLGRLFRARAVATAERAIGLFHQLTAHLAEAVTVEIADLRGGTSWRGDGLARDATRAAIDAARDIVARHAGVEITLYDDEDQLTLGAHLEIVIYSFSARWYYLLRGAGLEPYRALPSRSWRLGRSEFPPAPALSAALRDVVDRLGLAEMVT